MKLIQLQNNSLPGYFLSGALPGPSYCVATHRSLTRGVAQEQEAASGGDCGLSVECTTGYAGTMAGGSLFELQPNWYQNSVRAGVPCSLVRRIRSGDK